MIVVMKRQSTAEHVNHVVMIIQKMGFDSFVTNRAVGKVVEVLGTNGPVDPVSLENAPMVERVLHHSAPILVTGRHPEESTTLIPLNAVASLGGQKIGIIAGPCSVESLSQLLDIAAAVKEAGAVALRGGAFKPRTSPYSFHGHGEQGLEWLAQAREATGLAIVTEAMHCEHVDLVARYADVLQVGSRNMHNTELLAAVGRRSKPILLKRAWSATLEEFLSAAECIILEGNPNVILCERGIRTFETHVRNTLALSIVPEIKHMCRLPVIVDPSHGTGRRRLVTPMSKAAVACGADGLIIEVHGSPNQAWSDAEQSLDFDQFRSLMSSLIPLAEACGRTL